MKASSSSVLTTCLRCSLPRRYLLVQPEESSATCSQQAMQQQAHWMPHRTHPSPDTKKQRPCTASRFSTRYCPHASRGPMHPLFCPWATHAAHVPWAPGYTLPRGALAAAPPWPSRTPLAALQSCPQRHPPCHRPLRPRQSGLATPLHQCRLLGTLTLRASSALQMFGAGRRRWHPRMGFGGRGVVRPGTGRSGRRYPGWRRRLWRERQWEPMRCYRTGRRGVRSGWGWWRRWRGVRRRASRTRGC